MRGRFAIDCEGESTHLLLELGCGLCGEREEGGGSVGQGQELHVAAFQAPVRMPDVEGEAQTLGDDKLRSEDVFGSRDSLGRVGETFGKDLEEDMIVFGLCG